MDDVFASATSTSSASNSGADPAPAPASTNSSDGVHATADNTPRNPRILGIATDRNLVSYLVRSALSDSEMAFIFERTIEELNLGSARVVEIGADKTALDAMRLMSE